MSIDNLKTNNCIFCGNPATKWDFYGHIHNGKEILDAGWCGKQCANFYKIQSELTFSSACSTGNPVYCYGNWKPEYGIFGQVSEQKKEKSVKKRGAKSQIRSAAVIAKLLGAEGFSPFTANCVKKYYRNRCMTDNQKHRFVKVKQAFSEIAKKMSEGDKIILGKFIGYLSKMQFDTGLKLGLTAYAFNNEEKCDESGKMYC